jgi:hypothetical protein
VGLEGKDIPMIRLSPLQQLRDLDTASPQFHEQLSSCLRGSEYRNAVPNLQGEDLAWLVEYLDGVSLQTISPTLRSTSVRFSSVFPILQMSHSKNRCTNSERYAALKGCYRNRVHFQQTLSKDISLPSVSGYVYEGTLDGSKVRIKR